MCTGSSLNVNMPASAGECVCEPVCDVSCSNCEFVIVALLDCASSVISWEKGCLWRGAGP